MTARSLLALCLLASCFGCSLKRTATARRAPRNAETLMPVMRRQVINAVDAGDGDIEIRELRARVASSPEDLKARLELAGRYNDLGYPELAIEHCRLAAERFPNAPEAQEMLARSLRRGGLAKEAAASIEKYLAAAKPATPVLYSWLGIVRDDQKLFAEAEQAHRKALEFDPNKDVFHNNLGNNLLMQGKNEEAAAEFRQALKLNPKSDIARNNLGVALASNPQEAISLWESASDPATAHNNLGAVLMERKKYQEARKELETALGYKRDYTAALNNLSQISEADGQPVTLPGKKFENLWKRFSRTIENAVLGEDEKKQDGAGPAASR